MVTRIQFQFVIAGAYPVQFQFVAIVVEQCQTDSIIRQVMLKRLVNMIQDIDQAQIEVTLHHDPV